MADIADLFFELELSQLRRTDKKIYFSPCHDVHV